VSVYFGSLPYISADQIKCGNQHGLAELSSPEVMVKRDHYFQVHGRTEIFGGTGTQSIKINMLINDAGFTTQGSVYEYFESTINKLLGENNTLTLNNSDGSSTEFKFCTFDGYDLIPQSGQSVAVPLKDFSNNTFYIQTDLKFTRLSLGADSVSYDSTFDSSFL
jgi:hypothetical protein